MHLFSHEEIFGGFMESQRLHADGNLLTQDCQQFLTFTLDGGEFGISILDIQEIRNYSQVTPIPNSPHNLCGVINLRGTVIPIIDLRRTLELPSVNHDKFTVIIVINIDQLVQGLVVDSVSDVLEVRSTDIDVPPALASSSMSTLVRGIAKSEGRLISLLDIRELLPKEAQAH